MLWYLLKSPHGDILMRLFPVLNKKKKNALRELLKIIKRRINQKQIVNTR